MQITTIGIDLAKHVFQLHGIGPDGRVVLRQKLRRAPVLGLAPIGGSAMTLSIIGILAALGGFAAVYVGCVTHPEEGGYWRRDQSRASH